MLQGVGRFAIAQASTPPALVELVKACLQHNPARRPSMATVHALMGEWTASGTLEGITAEQAQAALRSAKRAEPKRASLWRRGLTAVGGAFRSWSAYTAPLAWAQLSTVRLNCQPAPYPRQTSSHQAHCPGLSQSGLGLPAQEPAVSHLLMPGRPNRSPAGCGRSTLLASAQRLWLPHCPPSGVLTAAGIPVARGHSRSLSLSGTAGASGL